MQMADFINYEAMIDEVKDRYQKLEDAAEELGDVFDQDKNNYTVKDNGFSFDGLKSLAPHHEEHKRFAEKFKEKTGIGTRGRA